MRERMKDARTKEEGRANEEGKNCDSGAHVSRGVEALAECSDAASHSVTRFVVEDGEVSTDRLDSVALARCVGGCDPVSGERRGRELLSPQADLVLDGAINAPKSFSIAALVHPGLATEFEGLQGRLRDRIIRTPSNSERFNGTRSLTRFPGHLE